MSNRTLERGLKDQDQVQSDLPSQYPELNIAINNVNATLIRELATDYVLPVKGNQPRLCDELKNFFDQAQDCGCDYAPLQEYMTEGKGHGRMEIRQIYVTGDIEWLPQKADWKDLRSLIKLVSVRRWEGKKGEEVR